ncbi:RING-H2 finger protein ATL63 [Gossypium australe]|uniref:RING-H2 finger protein ATL63 n=1 Tax=Gossypium australe TaxID=47621 RepID=A0A5B6WMS4_9ROSI|nr:RING-H2 finger protein ATL63 [Gossypium australe]
MVQGTIMRSTITTDNFKINPTMIQMIQNNFKFQGIMTEDLSQHLKRFLQLCDTFKYNRVINDVICLRTKVHYNMRRTCKKVPTKQYGPTKKGDCYVQTVRERVFVKLVSIKCPHPGLLEWLRLQIFYNVLDVHARSGLDRVAEGTLMNLTYEDAYELIENMDMNSCQ